MSSCLCLAIHEHSEIDISPWSLSVCWSPQIANCQISYLLDLCFTIFRKRLDMLFHDDAGLALSSRSTVLSTSISKTIPFSFSILTEAVFKCPKILCHLSHVLLCLAGHAWSCLPTPLTFIWKSQLTAHPSIMIIPLGAQILTPGDENKMATPASIAREIEIRLNGVSGVCTTFFRVMVEVFPSTVLSSFGTSSKSRSLSKSRNLMSRGRGVVDENFPVSCYMGSAC